MKRKMSFPIFANLTLSLMLILAGCGSTTGTSGGGGSTGGGSGTGGGGGTGTQIAVTITGPTNTIERGVNSPGYQLTANVTGTTNTAVQWSSSDSSVVSVSSTGALTPESTGSGPATATITATSQVDPSVSATYPVTVDDAFLAEANGVVSFNDVTKDVNNQLTTNDSSGARTVCKNPVFSPDHLEFACLESATSRIFNIYQLENGTTVKLVTSFDPSSQMGTKATDVLISSYAFTPNGKALVFNAVQDVSTGQAFVVDIINTDGTGFAQLFTGPTSIMNYVSVSPKGQIVFYNPSDAELWQMNTDGTNAHVLVNQASSVGFYSPDMSTLYWSGPTAGVWAMNASTGASTEILSGYNVLGIAPTGAFLLVTDGTNVYTFNPNGGGAAPQEVLSATTWASI
jgi:hypothetical protein